MRTYDKRIAFLISTQHFIPHGGIGSFCKSFTEMCNRLDWKIDILLDQAPSKPIYKNFAKLIEGLGGRIIYPSTSVSYSNHTVIFQKGESINFEKIINFRDCIMYSMETNLYDLIVCNTQEAMTAAYSLKLKDDIPVMFYTHLHSMIFREAQNFSDQFLDCYHNFYNKHMEFSDIYIGTQSQKNIDELTKFGASNCKLLRMPMSERKLLEPNYGERKGVLFIGRYEDGKNPEAYIKIMKECGLPCRVMTSETGIKKFEEAFNEAGITDYEIKAGITGEEKVDFITNSSVFFMPSLRENYPFAFMECLGHMPCVVLDKQDWSSNFDSSKYFITPLVDAAKLIKKLYSKDQSSHYASGALNYVKSLDESVAKEWVDFVQAAPHRESNINTAEINKVPKPIKYSDFIKSLGRKKLARIDFESVLTNRHKFNIKFTDTETYILSNDSSIIPQEEETGLSLFSF